jgi:hypothetical protein
LGVWRSDWKGDKNIVNRMIELEVLIDKNPELDIDRLECKIGKLLEEHGIPTQSRDHKDGKYGHLSIMENDHARD